MRVTSFQENSSVDTHLDTLSDKCNLSLGEENCQVSSKDYNFINSQFCVSEGKWGPGRDARCQGLVSGGNFCSQWPPQAPQTKDVLSLLPGTLSQEKCLGPAGDGCAGSGRAGATGRRGWPGYRTWSIHPDAIFPVISFPPAEKENSGHLGQSNQRQESWGTVSRCRPPGSAGQRCR